MYPYSQDFPNVINYKIFRNITQTQWIWIHVGVFFFELLDFFPLTKKTLWLPLYENLLFFLFSEIDRIFSLGCIAAYLLHLLGLYQKLRYLSFNYQHVQKNYYELKIHFYKTHHHLTMKNFLEHQIQYPIQN